MRIGLLTAMVSLSVALLPPASLAQTVTPFDEQMAKGVTAWRHHRYKDAEAAYQQALEMAQKSEADNVQAADAMNKLGVCFDREKQWETAAGYYKNALQIWLKKLGDDHPNVALVEKNLAYNALQQGKVSEAEDYAKRSVSALEKSEGHDSTRTSNSLLTLGEVYRKQDKFKDAETAFTQALAIRRKVLSENSPRIAFVDGCLASLYLKEERWADAEQYALDAVTISEKQVKKNPADQVFYLKYLADAYSGLGKQAELGVVQKQIAALSAVSPTKSGTAGGGSTLASSSMGGEDALLPDELFERISPSVFLVLVHSRKDPKGAFLGSAVVVAPHILVTNDHVIRDGSEIIVVKDKSIFPAAIIKEDRNTDLAILSCPSINALPVKMRSVGTVKVGERVYAIGSPKGLENTLSEGLVSGIRERDATHKLIQTSAAISHGSSGGGLFDAEGRLIGITTSIIKEAQNLDMATPTDYVAYLLPSTASSGVALAHSTGAGAVLPAEPVSIPSTYSAGSSVIPSPSPAADAYVASVVRLVKAHWNPPKLKTLATHAIELDLRIKSDGNAEVVKVDAPGADLATMDAATTAVYSAAPFPLPVPQAVSANIVRVSLKYKVEWKAPAMDQNPNERHQ